MHQEDIVKHLTVSWMALRPGCTAEVAASLYAQAKIAAAALEQAEKDDEAQKLLEESDDSAD